MTQQLDPQACDVDIRQLPPGESLGIGTLFEHDRGHVLVAVEDLQEAHYLCALLNSSLAGFLSATVAGLLI